MMYNKAWVNKGVLKISDLLDNHDQFLSFENFKRKFNVRCTFLDYGGVIAAIPKAWKNEITSNIARDVSEPSNADTNNHDTVTAKQARLMLAEKSFSPPTVEITLSNLVTNVKDVYELPFRVTIESKMRSFQYKLIHNIIPTNLSLHRMKIKESPFCDHCNGQNETLLHRFCECPKVKSFWEDVIKWWNIRRSDNLKPNSCEILYGYKPENTKFHAFNHYLLIAKYHLYLARNQSETPSMKVFLALLESKIKCERQIAVKNSNNKKYEAKWTTLCISNALAFTPLSE